MYSNEPNLVPVNGYNIFETVKAVKAFLKFKDKRVQVWVPKKFCEDWPDVGEYGEFLIEDWWLGKNDFI